MDPQQGSLLSHAAGLVRPDTSTALPTAVFVGIARVIDSAAASASTLAAIAAGSGHAATGKALSAAAGRLSYTFALTGPCVSLDTACSSSLLALHLAAGAVRGRETGTALAAGVNLPMVCETTAAFAAAGETG